MMDEHTLRKVIALIEERIRVKREQALILKSALAEDLEIKEELERKLAATSTVSDDA
jgi:hypothetical protein